ncbi:unnamed protein product [Ectocarpus sp. CCAP 1310/34]|nr:unnamed protein product [Ectocarpus sp. CCAP 1310/34]
MGGSQQHVAAASLGLAAALCIPLVLVVRYRKSRAYPIAARALNKPVMERTPPATTTAAAVRRAPEEDEQVFSLYGRSDGDSNVDAERLAPPIELSGNVLALLDSFDVDPVRGFLPPVDPLRRLPQRELQPWEAMAAALPSLLAVGQARKPLEELPELSIDVLTCQRERMRALLLLCVFAHASVWGNPEQPQGTIPKSIAVPLAALAAAEGMPPLLTHTSLVLHNWHRLDPAGPLRTENLACNCHFLGGLDETWFYISTVEIEARGGGVFGALLEAQHAIAEADSGSDASTAAGVVLDALAVACAGIVSMREALARMPVGCHPLIFYQRVRPFLSGWKANPTLPDGVVYEGVSSKRRQYYGGSAAQSTLFPALDAALEVSHSAHSSNAFLLEMRKYMPPGHRRLLEHLADPACPSIRRFVQNFARRRSQALPSKSGGAGTGGDTPDDVTVKNGETTSGNGCRGGDTTAAAALKEAYNSCLGALSDFRSTHLGIVGSYILQQQKKDQKAGEAKSREDFAGGKGTGGTPLLDFLKPLKNDSRAVRLE